MLELQFREGFPEVYMGQSKLYVFEISLKDGSRRKALVRKDLDERPNWIDLDNKKVVPEDTVLGWRETYNCGAARQDVDAYFKHPGSVVGKDWLADAFARHINRENCSECRNYFEGIFNSQPRQLPVIEKEIICNVGQNWQSKELFIGELKGLDSEVAHLVAKELHIDPTTLHNLTCIIINGYTKSGITNECYLVNKLLKLKVKIVIEQCELIDDVPAEPEQVQG